MTAEHPYSPATNVDNFGFVSGALSIDEHGVAVPGRTQAFEAAMARLEERIQTIDMELEDVIKATYFVTDVSMRAEANVHFQRVFSEPRPARSFVGVSELPYGATVEIEATARKGWRNV